MAYASLVSLAQTLDKLLQNHDQEQQIKCLHDHLIFLQAFLEDSSEKLTDKLEARIRDASNEAEDVIEAFISKEIQSVLKFPQHQVELRFRFDFQALNQVLGKIPEEIDSIVEEVMEIQNSISIKSSEKGQLRDSSAAASSLRLPPSSKDSIVDFGDELMSIKIRLCGESSKLQMIPIVGMGGIGKTTLAKNAFDDQLIVEHFLIRVWVTISQNHNSQVILSNLLMFMNAFNDEHEESSESKEELVDKSLEGGEINDSNESIEELVYKSLKGRRYLIVMDDVWSTELWDDIRRIIPNNNNGSRIMFTTRLLDVAAYLAPCSPLHEMLFMDADRSWNLLQKKVFIGGNSCPPELVSIGREIAKCCRGLPLAIVVIAGLLSTVSKTPDSWESIARNVRLDVTTNNEEYAYILLSLSYNHLDQHLRPCFLYMGVFPEDWEIRVSELIKLWVAEGFLKPSEEFRSFEELAENYLEDLVKRSLVFVTKRKSNGKIKSCNVHDLVRDLCIKKAHEEKFFGHISDRYVRCDRADIIQNQRRMSIAPSGMRCLETIYGSTIRTIIICFWPSVGLSGFLKSCKLLRVLHLLTFGKNWIYPPLPKQVFELFHLRYLVVDYTMISSAISNLRNLQTLIIYPMKKLKSNLLPPRVPLPLQIWTMPQLRHVISFSFDLLPVPEGATLALENLQTLSKATNFICHEKILKRIPNLKKLGIYYVGDEYVEDYHLDNLVFLHQLEKLRLKVDVDFPFKRKLNPIFPKTLKKLTLSGWKLDWKDMGTVSLLPDLEVLRLRNNACLGDKWETREGEFLKLKFLLIGRSKLRKWITESSHFPSLKYLKLYFCLNLSEIPDGIGEIPTLELIEVGDMNKSLVKSAKRIRLRKKQRQNWGNYALQVRVPKKETVSVWSY